MLPSAPPSPGNQIFPTWCRSSDTQGPCHRLDVLWAQLGRRLSSPNTAGEPGARTSFPMADEHLKWIRELFHPGISSV